MNIRDVFVSHISSVSVGVSMFKMWGCCQVGKGTQVIERHNACGCWVEGLRERDRRRPSAFYHVLGANTGVPIGEATPTYS